MQTLGVVQWTTGLLARQVVEAVSERSDLGVQGQPAVTLHLGLPPDGVENVTTADMTGFDHLVTAMSSLDAIGGVVAEPPGFPTHGEVSAMAAPIRQVSG